MPRHRKLWFALAAVLLASGAGAAGWWWSHRAPGETSAPGRFQVRATRRAYDGAPPVIPHAPLGGSCTDCHTTAARILPGLGIAPANPHLRTPGLSAFSRCQQCHVFRTSDELFVETGFRGLAQRPV